MIPDHVAVPAQPSHVEWLRVIIMRGLRRLFCRDITVLADLGTDQDALFQGFAKLIPGFFVDRYSLGVLLPPPLLAGSSAPVDLGLGQHRVAFGSTLGAHEAPEPSVDGSGRSETSILAL
jgi:hypothetical protein